MTELFQLLGSLHPATQVALILAGTVLLLACLYMIYRIVA